MKKLQLEHQACLKLCEIDDRRDLTGFDWMSSSEALNSAIKWQKGPM